MSKKSFYVDLDLSLNQLLNTRVENMLGPPSSGIVPGRIIYDTRGGIRAISYYDGNIWRTMGGVLNVDGTEPIFVTELNGIYNVQIREASSGTPGSMSSDDYIKLESLKIILDDTDLPHLPNAADQIITGANVNVALSDLDLWQTTHIIVASRPHGELLETDRSDDGAMGGGSPSNILVSSQRAAKFYIDSLVVGAGRPALPFDPTDILQAGTPNNYPLMAYGTDNKILPGDQFIITTKGAVAGVTVNPNDTLIASVEILDDTTGVSGSQNPDNWNEIISTPVNPASTTVMGIAEIATQAEVDALSDDTRFVTPATLKTTVDKYHVVKEAHITGSGSSLKVTHGWGTKNVTATTIDLGTDLEFDSEITINGNDVVANINTIPGPWALVVIG